MSKQRNAEATKAEALDTRRAEIAYGLDSLIRDLANDPAVAAAVKDMEKPGAHMFLAGMLVAYHQRAKTLQADIAQLNMDERSPKSLVVQDGSRAIVKR